MGAASGVLCICRQRAIGSPSDRHTCSIEQYFAFTRQIWGKGLLFLPLGCLILRREGFSEFAGIIVIVFAFLFFIASKRETRSRLFFSIPSAVDYGTVVSPFGAAFCLSPQVYLLCYFSVGGFSGGGGDIGSIRSSAQGGSQQTTTKTTTTKTTTVQSRA